MQMIEIFYGIFWISAISVVWFYTDWIEHYLQLFGVFEQFRLRYRSFIIDHPDSYFPDFLHYVSLTTGNRFCKFILKLLSCPFCLIFWLSMVASVLLQNMLLVPVFYVCSLFIVLQIKKLI
jgi:hypothetical protein